MTEGRMSDKRYTVHVCQGTGCVSGGSDKIFALLKDEIYEATSNGEISLKSTGCHGFCQQGPLIVIEPEGALYSKVKTDDVPEVMQSILPGGTPLDRFFYHDS